MTPCPASETLEQLLSRDPAVRAADTVRAHVDSCPLCQDRLDALRARAAGSADGSRLTEESCADTDAGRSSQGTRSQSTPAQPDSNSAGDAAAGLLPFLGPPRRAGDLGTLGPYSVECVLGRGGMGVVLKAFDEALRRDVAVKVLRPDLADEQARARFVQEARAAAQIRHEHVIRVHAVSDPGAPLPYFVMEYLEGPTLAQVIRAEQCLEPRRAARLAAQAAAGLAAAHAAGLVHRDVKPGNLILDPASDRLAVTDFGLVKRLDGADRQTHTGAILGTPCYMAPEQAGGVARTVGPAADVYGLGAVLYEMLTGRPPFLAGSPMETVLLVLTADPVPPRRLQPKLPRDLETICLKALAKEPRRRYGSAGEFGDDLNRWLRGEPIRARPVGPLGRGWRWCRRKPVVAVLAAALLLALVGGLAGVVRQGLRAQDHAARAEDNAARAEAKAREVRQALDLAEQRRGEAERERGLAERRLQDSLRVIDHYLVEVSENALPNHPGLQKLRKNLLTDAVTYLEKLLAERARDPGLPHRAVTNHFRLGKVLAMLGEGDRALPHLERACAQQQEVLRVWPDNDTYQGDLASCYALRARLLGQRGDTAGALRLQEQARRIWEKLPADSKGFHNGPASLAACYADLARLKLATGDHPEALRLCECSLGLRRKLVAAHPKEPRFRDDLAVGHVNTGGLLSALGRREQALRSFEQAQTLFVELARESPAAALLYEPKLAGTLYTLGALRARLGYPHAGLVQVAEATARFETLLRANPDVASYKADLANCHANAGEIYESLGRLSEALRSNLAAASLRRQLVATDPGSVEARVGLLAALHRASVLHGLAGEPAEAAHLLREALGLGEKLVAQAPRRAGVREALAQVCQALDLQRRAEALWRGLVADRSRDPGPREGLVRALLGVALAARRPDQANAALEEAKSLARKLAAEEPKAQRSWVLLALTHDGTAALRSKQGDRPGALRAYREAFALLEKALEKPPRGSAVRRLLASGHEKAGKLCASSNSPDEALSHFERAAALYEPLAAQAPGGEAAGRLAEVHRECALAHAGRDRPAAALASYREELKWRRRLAAAHPGNIRAEINLGRVCHRVAVSYEQTGAPARALPLLEEACRIQEALAERHLGAKDVQADLAWSAGDWAALLRQAGKRAEALRAARRSCAVWRRAIGDGPAPRAWWAQRARACTLLGELHAAGGQTEAALGAYREARSVWERLVKLAPEDSGLREGQARCGLALATLGARAHAADALAAAILARDLFAKLHALAPARVERRADLAAALAVLGEVLLDLERPRAALIALRDAVRHQEAARAGVPKSSEHGRRLGTYLSALGLAQRGLGDWAGAAGTARRRLALWPNEPRELLHAARELARCVPQVAQGKLAPGEAEKARQRLVAEALAALRRAVACGYRDAAALETDGAFAPLRTHPEYKKLVAGLR